MGPSHADAQLGRGDHPAHAPACHRVRLRHRVDRDGPVGHAGQRGERDVLALEHDVLVDVVGERKQVVLQAEVRDEFELVAPENLAGRVVRRVDDDRPGPRRHGGAQLIGVDRPVRFVERHVARRGPGEDRVGAVVLVERLEHDDLVARIEQAEHRRDHSLRRPAHHRDLGVGVGLPARIEASGLRGDGTPERRRAGDDRVLVDVGEQRGRGRLLELRGGREVREALGQADGAGLDRQAVHLPDNGLGEALGLPADAAHGGESSGRAKRASSRW